MSKDDLDLYLYELRSASEIFRLQAYETCDWTLDKLAEDFTRNIEEAALNSREAFALGSYLEICGVLNDQMIN